MGVINPSRNWNTLAEQPEGNSLPLSFRKSCPVNWSTSATYLPARLFRGIRSQAAGKLRPPLGSGLAAKG